MTSCMGYNIVKLCNPKCYGLRNNTLNRFGKRLCCGLQVYVHIDIYVRRKVCCKIRVVQSWDPSVKVVKCTSTSLLERGAKLTVSGKNLKYTGYSYSKR